MKKSEKVVTIPTAGLLSKWGFGDGDMLDDIWYDYDDLYGEPKISTTQFIILVVKKFVIPKIKNKLEDIQEIESIHNPIRVGKVDGVEVNHFIHSSEQTIKLEPEYVNVPMDDLLSLL